MKSGSTFSPTARITVSQSTRTTSSVGTGRRRPEVSNSPSFVFTTSIAFTAPCLSPTIRWGVARKRNCTPSCSAASISSGIAGMSFRSRR